MSHRLEAADRRAELLAHVRVGDGHVEGLLHRADALHRGQGPTESHERFQRAGVRDALRGNLLVADVAHGGAADGAQGLGVNPGVSSIDEVKSHLPVFASRHHVMRREVPVVDEGLLAGDRTVSNFE